MTTQKVHVAFMVGSLRVGGAERMMVNTANELAKRWQVSFLSLTGGTALKGELSNNVTVHSFEKKSSLSAIPAILAFIRKEKPDVLISTQIHVNLIALILKLFFRVKTKIILREATSPASHFMMNTGFKQRLVSIAVRLLYPNADAIIAICEAVKKSLIESTNSPPAKISVIYNPVINDRFRMAVMENVEHPFLNKNIPVFISVGRLAPAKNFSLLISSFSMVLKKKDARLIIVGEGSERKNLEKLIESFQLQEKIFLAGEITNPYPWMKSSDVYVLSSLYEGLPNALIEAMGCGLQLVSTDCPGGSREILMDGKCGKLVKMNDPEALADAMLESLIHPLDKTAMTESLKRFESTTVGEQYFSLIMRLTT